MKKISSLIILLILTLLITKVSFVNADFIENMLNMNSWIEELNLNKHTLYDPRLNNKIMQERYYNLKKSNKEIKKALINEYKEGGFWYYQMQGIVRNYSNFIYYSNKYFSSLKKREIYWNSKEVKSNIEENFSYMVSYYKKFKSLLYLKY